MSQRPKKAAPQSPPSLDELISECWTALSAGTRRAGHPFHTGVLGTGGAGGCDLRTVVLRGVDRGERRLSCHSDARSRKIEQIRSDPRVSWLFYDDRHKVQLRLRGAATVHVEDGVALTRWHSTPPRSRRCYGVEPGPGSPTGNADSGLPPELLERVPTSEESEPWFDRFAVIVTHVDQMEWLHLRARGHLRAGFDWSHGALRATWLIP